MPTFTADWFSPNIPALKEILKSYIDKECLILELGCFEGRATLWFLNYLPKSVVEAVDVFFETPEYKQYGGYTHSYEETFRGNVESYGERVYTHKDSSFDYLVQALSTKPRVLFDIIYVDGSHEAINVLKDMLLGWEVLKTGGVMICDDYAWTRRVDCPKIAIDIFLSLYAGKYELLEKGYQVAVRKL
jgi:predicted O-methyltransferase YrrM